MNNKLLLFIILFMLSCFITTLSSQENEESKETDKIDFELPKNPSFAGAMSIIIPGAGQFYNEKYLKGSLFILTQAGLTSAVIHYNKKTKEYRKKVHALDEIDYALQRKYEEYYEEKQSYIFWLGASIFLSGIDAFVDAHLFNYELKKKEIRLKFEDEKLLLSIGF
ncbi:MAG: DUF5683 domain-containing protein [Candidatus Cloacimonetes bacterium]|nr:DUF5683 domain-containing protein [Candidatus Cloacimonadota bacterium]MDD4156988.1 DUF5683 domain-containing protein [Candidatus Cloacimonadota bacterium]